MSSSNRTPLQDITNGQSKDPKEVKRQRDRERYAKNKDEISKRRRELRELKKKKTTHLNDENTLCDTQPIGQSGVTQIQNMDNEESMALDGDDESDWLHRCDAYQMQATPCGKRHVLAGQNHLHGAGSPTQITGVVEIVECNNVSVEQMGASSSQSGMCFSTTNESRRGRRQHTGQGWYARLSNEKKAEYLERQRIARQQKKAAKTSAGEVSQTSSACLPSSPCTPFSNVINTHTNGIFGYASPVRNSHQTSHGFQDCSGSGQKWYAQLTDKQKTEHLMKMRVSWQQKKATDLGVRTMVPQTPGVRDIGSAYLGINRDLQTSCSEATMEHVSTSTDLHGQDSFLAKSTNSDKRRQHGREIYSLMTDEQREVCLHKNREYKKSKRKTRTFFGQDIVGEPTAMQVQASSRNNRIDETNSDEDSDPTGIFEPIEQGVVLEDNLDTIQEDQTMHDDDEECRIFSGQGDVFDSWQLTNVEAPTKQNDDPYDYVYHNLPRKHHVLKPVKDCDHCGAMRLQCEGPTFCCRKGKVKIVTPEVPQELRRLFTSQVDDDAKYFRKHIRYFNTHFSFTSLGVTLDQKVSNAAGTGVYTFRTQGALYHRMDDLVPGGQGPRHLQLYINDTDETLEHRVKRSPDLDINIIRKILKILENNPYVQTFKSIGSVPNLAEYQISLKTDIRLDQQRYNAPTASQVAAMWVEGSDPENTFDRQVVVYGKGDRPIFIRAYYGCYDPLAYPLFFPGGETGWNRWMPYEVPPPANEENNEDGTEGEESQFLDRTSEVHVDQNTDEVADDAEDEEGDEVGASRKFVSAREYYCFKLQVRKKLFNIILFGARAFQQWDVDMYIKMETMRLDFYSKPKNQKLIRADLYQYFSSTSIETTRNKVHVLMLTRFIVS